MPNYISLNFNHTPLDFHQLEERYHDGKKIDLQEPKTKKPFSNILLVVGIIAFVLSLSYTITADRFSTKSKASEKSAKPTPRVIKVETPTSSIKDYPKFYKEEEIPQELYDAIKKIYSQDTPGRKNYVIDKVVRYYIYQDVITENDLTYVPSEKEDALEKLIEDVNSMQKVINETIFAQETPPYKDLNTLIKEKLINFR